MFPHFPTEGELKAAWQVDVFLALGHYRRLTYNPQELINPDNLEGLREMLELIEEFFAHCR